VAPDRHVWREAVLAAAGFAAVALVMTWPTMRHPAATLPGDLYDPTVEAWWLAWVGHALVTAPLDVWQTNAFYPMPDTLAFGEPLLGYAPLAAIGAGIPAAVLRYNAVYVLTFALASTGMYALARQAGAGRFGSAVAAFGFAYGPWRLAHSVHLNILSAGGIPLALAMLGRGHGWSLAGSPGRGAIRPGWAVAGWLVAAWQLSLGFALGLPFAYLLFGIAVLTVRAWWRGRAAPGRRLIVADLIGGLAFASTGLLVGRVYLRVVGDHPEAVRGPDDLNTFSPPWHGLVTASQQSWYGRLLPPGEHLASIEWALSPGWLLLLAGVSGVVTTVWRRRAARWLGIGAVVSAWLSLGTTTPFNGLLGYSLLYGLPGFGSIRTPGRLCLYTSMLLALLAAGAVTRATHAAGDWARGLPFRRVMVIGTAFALVGGLVLEGLPAVQHPRVPGPPTRLSALAQPLVVLPAGRPSDMPVMLWTTDGFPRVLNGASSFDPSFAFRESLQEFPSPRTVAVLREIGVRTVVVDRSRSAADTLPARIRAAARFGVTAFLRDDAVVFTL
jgi:hypothetical protein